MLFVHLSPSRTQITLFPTRFNNFSQLKYFLDSKYIISKNLTNHQKPRQFLEELRDNFETLYEEIGYMISTSQTLRAELMYRKKVVQWGEKYSEIDVQKTSTNRFASLAGSDVQFKRTDNYREIFGYLHEKGMMKVATQSPIKKVPAKPKQTLKNFEKAHKTKTKKKSTQTAEKGNDKLEDTSTKKKPDKILRKTKS
ncbi:Hypothetical_protein [Hexamita inflata]|uniref:Hypothetical_protein n=1 Tax=Hexamita inflata TaxID=28002 RepID=A0AA86NYJ9_9EUKA|nr:Hypothetical protein HINF_LOCUS16024 [Hexamita inflata]